MNHSYLMKLLFHVIIHDTMYLLCINGFTMVSMVPVLFCFFVFFVFFTIAFTVLHLVTLTVKDDSLHRSGHVVQSRGN